jgi:transposase
MASIQTVLHGKDTASEGDLCRSFELGDRSWKLAIGDGRRGLSRYGIDAGDTAAAIDRAAKARWRLGHSTKAMLHSCYGAGRDGWWLSPVADRSRHRPHRGRLCEHRSHPARAACKSDRLEGDKLAAMLLRHHGGERIEELSVTWSKAETRTGLRQGLRRTQPPGRPMPSHRNSLTSHTRASASCRSSRFAISTTRCGSRGRARWQRDRGERREALRSCPLPTSVDRSTTTGSVRTGPLEARPRVARASSLQRPHCEKKWLCARGARNRTQAALDAGAS